MGTVGRWYYHDGHQQWRPFDDIDQFDIENAFRKHKNYIRLFGDIPPLPGSDVISFQRLLLRRKPLMGPKLDIDVKRNVVPVALSDLSHGDILNYVTQWTTEDEMFNQAGLAENLVNLASKHGDCANEVIIYSLVYTFNLSIAYSLRASTFRWLPFRNC